MLLNQFRSDTDARALPPYDVPPPEPGAVEHHGYRSSGNNRWVGLGGTALVYMLVLSGLFLTVNHMIPMKAPPTLTVMDLKHPASPPETPPEEKEAPNPVKKKITLPEPVPAEPFKPTIRPISEVTIPIPDEARPADPTPKQVETAAPRTTPAPPAPEVSGNGPDTWEGRVLAALNKHRRYPRFAMARRQQGMPWVRFVIDRDGKVLSVSLERSSGFPDLDREALALPKRAQPLPKPPNDRQGDTIELVAPVEFFLK
ncbi:protein TonB [Novosphingobium sp. CF614]|uniref:energy transducer TonB family protein n=1 Tax=Novosphingobium sp. CF614 TaxID=1884364 RepID=UPI0008EA66F2|nr:energy transducer TonB [Novosphingobium sp. CF614]SFG34446.1 protein TonB [Novosphingobium sp. CF614]